MEKNYIVNVTIEVIVVAATDEREMIDYVTNITASSNLGAEKEVLSIGGCVKYAQAYSEKETNTETFRAMIAKSKFISFHELCERATKQNDIADRIEETKKLIEEKENELNNLSWNIQYCW